MVSRSSETPLQPQTDKPRNTKDLGNYLRLSLSILDLFCGFGCVNWTYDFVPSSDNPSNDRKIITLTASRHLENTSAFRNVNKICIRWYKHVGSGNILWNHNIIVENRICVYVYFSMTIPMYISKMLRKNVPKWFKHVPGHDSLRSQVASPYVTFGNVTTLDTVPEMFLYVFIRRNAPHISS